MERKNHIADILKQAEEGIRAVYDSENYIECLRIMSKFHNYSIRNILLIKSARPDATYVAGYQKWKREFKRHVKKGEQGIPIIAFTPKIKRTEEMVDDGNGNTTPTVVKDIIPYFSVKYVYDISQTEGEPLPKLTENLMGNVDNYDILFQSISDISPFDVCFEKIEGVANGYCSHKNKKIVIKEGMSQAQNVKTAIHEIAHADMHGDKTLGIGKETIEVEAESVAFAVCEHFGLDTSSYSFPYIASWSSGKELSEMEESLDRIQHKADDLITRIEERYIFLEPPEAVVNKSVKGDRANTLTTDQLLSTEQVKLCLDYGIPVGYYAVQDKESRKQVTNLDSILHISDDEFNASYENVYKDIKVISQVKEGTGNDDFCYPDTGCMSMTINPYVMNEAESASTKFLLTEYMESQHWDKIDESLRHNYPVRYDNVLAIRDKYLDEAYFEEVTKKYPDRSIAEIRTLAGYLTIEESSRDVHLRGYDGVWNISDYENISGNDYFLLYNNLNSKNEVIVDRSGKVYMDRDCNFEELKSLLEETQSAEKEPAKKSGSKKKESKER